MPVFKAIGSVLKFMDTQAENTFYPVSQIKTMSGPTAKPKVLDVTTHDVSFTDSGGAQQFWTRKLPVLIDSGEFSIELFYDPNDHMQGLTSGVSLWQAMVKMHITDMYVVFPPGGAFPNGLGQLFFSGYITQYEFSLPVDNAITAKIQVTITDHIDASMP